MMSGGRAWCCASLLQECLCTCQVRAGRSNCSAAASCNVDGLLFQGQLVWCLISHRLGWSESAVAEPDNVVQLGLQSAGLCICTMSRALPTFSCTCCVACAEINQSTHFEKLLRNLRPGYDWIPAEQQEPAAAAGNGPSADAAAANGNQQQQQLLGHWVRRDIGEELLRKCNMELKEVKVRATVASTRTVQACANGIVCTTRLMHVCQRSTVMRRQQRAVE